jgi:hypothetical protein
MSKIQNFIFTRKRIDFLLKYISVTVFGDFLSTFWQKIIRYHGRPRMQKVTKLAFFSKIEAYR